MLHQVITFYEPEIDNEPKFDFSFVPMSDIVSIVKTNLENPKGNGLIIDSNMINDGGFSKEYISTTKLEHANKIYATIGVYADNSYKTNGVAECNIGFHIAYNVNYRFGRALIIDGICVYKGNLKDDEIQKVIDKYNSGEIKKHDKDTQPYH